MISRQFIQIHVVACDFNWSIGFKWFQSICVDLCRSVVFLDHCNMSPTHFTILKQVYVSANVSYGFKWSEFDSCIFNWVWMPSNCFEKCMIRNYTETFQVILNRCVQVVSSNFMWSKNDTTQFQMIQNGFKLFQMCPASPNNFKRSSISWNKWTRIRSIR